MPYKIRSVVVLEERYKDYINAHFGVSPFEGDEFFIFMGEITNMRGHGIYIGMDTGKIYSGYHFEDFRLPTDKEF